ncbi:MAG: peptidylprolyl isomerase, partial [Roseibacillus sp.]|nr:peptidylprolyl isomerase [Roseibacillus sp.]
MPRFALPLLLLPLAPCAPAQILADFEISLQDKEFGRFTVQFDHYNSPHAAANFIRLAEGLVPWLDGSAGKVRKEPFYDGLTFHSVTAGVEIAGGSRTGNGDDNPGWTIRDDFTSPGGGTYTMFMENDGPNSNGSRFFINLPATINANPRRAGGHYTAVGRVLQATTPPGG